MKIEDYSSGGNPTQTSELPDDFARVVIVKARALEQRRKLRGRISAGVAVLLIAAAMPVANFIPSWTANLVSRRTPAFDAIASYQRAADQVAALSLAEAAKPDAVGDYLLPNTTALTQSASAYDDASWDYDPDWTASSDTSTGG